LNFNNLDSDIPRPNPSLLAPAITAGEFNILPVSILLIRNSPIAGDDFLLKDLKSYLHLPSAESQL